MIYIIVFVCIAALVWIANSILVDKAIKGNSKGIKGNILSISKKFEKQSDTKMEKLFYLAKNPWHLAIGTFKLIRYSLTALFAMLAIILYNVDSSFTLLFGLLAALSWWYPIYYYKGVAEERELEWNKFYEYIWVLKHNAMLYSPERVFLETETYIKKHAPHNKELIQAFRDFYEYWDDNEIDDYIRRTYSFAIPTEIYQILYNMNKSGVYPEAELSNLRKFIVNSQNTKVEMNLSKVTSSATLASLPFMMISVIIGFMIPMISQIFSLF